MIEPNAQKTQFDAAEKQLIFRCWATYTAFYLGRVNISPAFPLIALTLGLTLGEVGWLGTVFFWSYGIGQLVLGQLGNVIRPRWLVLAGLCTIAATNLLFASQNHIQPLLLLWAINGFAQAAGWGPLLRILRATFNAGQNRKLATPFAMSFQIGTAISWMLSLLLISVGTDWRALFWLPGLVLTLVSLAWWFSGIDAKPMNEPSSSSKIHWREVGLEIQTWWPLLLSAAVSGFVYLGLLLWLPTLLSENVPLPENWLRFQTALLPLMGIPGMWIAGQLLAKGRNPLQASALLQMALIFAFLCSTIWGGWVSLVAMLVAVFAASGLASLTLSAFPLLLARSGRVSSAGGMLTAVWSIAGGTSGTLIGRLADLDQWESVFAIWTICMMIAFIFVCWVEKQGRFTK
ncbi:MAG: MFS transporter [Anaerolineaceae bacterium]|nr:MFS transporter [Anaerolineaceae bacterium]